MNKKLAIPLCLILTTLLLSACGFRIVNGSGHVITETRQVKDFDKVVLAGIGNIILTQGDEESLQIEADDNLMSYLDTTVSDGTLTIEIDNEGWFVHLRPTRTIKFYLSMKDIQGVKISGSGNVTAERIDTDQLELKISGSGKITTDEVIADEITAKITGSGSIILNEVTAENVSTTISGSGECNLEDGRVNEQKLTISGSGDYNADKLESQTASVTVSGSGGGTLWVTELLDVRISGSGGIHYYGSPQVNTHITGSGKVRSQGNP
jgi:hypothetical protein